MYISLSCVSTSLSCVHQFIMCVSTNLKHVKAAELMVTMLQEKEVLIAIRSQTPRHHDHIKTKPLSLHYLNGSSYNSLAGDILVSQATREMMNDAELLSLLDHIRRNEPLCLGHLPAGKITFHDIISWEANICHSNNRRLSVSLVTIHHNTSRLPWQPDAMVFELQLIVSWGLFGYHQVH